MSADNGYIIRENSAGQFVLQMYFASQEDYPPIEEASESERYETLDDAITAYEEDPGHESEYGLRIFSIVSKKPTKKPDVHVVAAVIKRALLSGGNVTEVSQKTAAEVLALFP